MNLQLKGRATVVFCRRDGGSVQDIRSDKIVTFVPVDVPDVLDMSSSSLGRVITELYASQLDNLEVWLYDVNNKVPHGRTLLKNFPTA